MSSGASKWMGGRLLAIGLGALLPAGLALTAASAALWSAPAEAAKPRGNEVAAGNRGMVIRHIADGTTILAPADLEGVVRLTGLAAGEYAVKPFGEVAPVTMKVGRDGRLAFVARQGSAKATVRTAEAKPGAAIPATRSQVEQIAFADDPRASAPDAFDTRSAAIIDVNTANADQLMKGTNNSREAAAFIVAEREKSGSYKSPQDFVQRVSSNVDVDFGYASARMGDTTIIARTGNPKSPGFKTAVKSDVVEVYGHQRQRDLQFAARFDF